MKPSAHFSTVPAQLRLSALLGPVLPRAQHLLSGGARTAAGRREVRAFQPWAPDPAAPQRPRENARGSAAAVRP